MNPFAHSKSLRRFALALLACSFIYAPALADQRLVPSQYRTIQDAIDASVNGDEVIIADGTYTGVGNRALNFNGKLITVRSAGGNPAACVIDCENAASAFTFNQGETSAATISGLTVTHTTNAVSVSGSAAPTVTNCAFVANSMYSIIDVSSSTSVIMNGCSIVGNTGCSTVISNNGSVFLNDCTFADNHCDGSGTGAIHCLAGSHLSATGCTFRDNSSLSWGAITIIGTGTLQDCLFVDNVPQSAGAPGPLRIRGRARVLNCRFFGNESGQSGRGGAIQVQEDVASVSIANCVFSGNQGGTGGGGAIAAFDSAKVQIVNSTFAGNTAASGGAFHVSDNANARIVNCILWSNAPNQVATATGGTASVSYSDVQGGFAGTGNVNLDPNFADANGLDNIIGTEDDDLRLAPGSPVIDDGHNVPFHFTSDARGWLALRPTAGTYAIDQFKPGFAGATGCTTDGDWQPTLPLTGGTAEFLATGSTGIFYCPLVDGSTGPAVSDGALSSPVVKLRVDFVPPITAFHTFYGSLEIGDTATMRLFSGATQVGQYTSGVSAHSTQAIGHGFSSLVPIDRVEISTTDTATVVGAFNALAAGETSLGTVNVPQYAGLPQGATTQKDFGVVFGSADLPGDLDGHLRVRNGDVDMGAYEFNPCPGDITGDGLVNVNDLLAVVSTWGATGPNQADINNDGTVNVNDLLAVITAWGACP